MSSLVLSGLVAFIELTLVSTALAKIVRGHMRAVYQVATLLELACAVWLAVAVSTAALAAATVVLLAFAAYRLSIAKKKSACGCAGRVQVVEVPEVLGVVTLAVIAAVATGLSASGWTSYPLAVACAGLGPVAVLLYGRMRTTPR
jgi:hypothetical protein